MSTPDPGATVETADREAIQEREESFFRQMGVSELSYPHALEDAVVHARRAPVAGDARWYPSGPRNVGGRITALAQDPTNALTLYAGSAHGGLWRTIDGGDTWTHLGAEEFNVPVGTIAIHPRQPGLLYVGTGSLKHTYAAGRGLFRVQVAGPLAPAAFDRLAATDPPDVAPAASRDGRAYRYTRIEVDPDAPERFWAASQTGLWRCVVPVAPFPHAAGSAVFTRDFPPDPPAAGSPPLFSGAVPVPGAGWPAYATDVRVARDPRSTDTHAGLSRYLVIYVGVYGEGVWRGRYDRKDDRVEWEKKLDVPGAGASFQRVRLAVCANRPQHVYVVFADPGDMATEVYYSGDSGEHWEKRGQIPAASNGQADYDLVLEVNPFNPDVLLCAAVDVCKSEDGAKNWTPVAHWRFYDRGDHAQHADFHAAIFDVADRRRVWVGNDGGISVLDDLRRIKSPVPLSWRKRSHGILAGQFQDIAVSPALPFVSAGGLQDNGSWASFGGPTWYRIGWADGAGVAFHSGDPRTFFPAQNSAGNMTSVTVAAHQPFVIPPARRYLFSLVSHDVPTPAGATPDALELRMDPIPLPQSSPFVTVVAEDPTTPGQILIGATANPSGGPQALAYWAPPPPAGPYAAFPAALPAPLAVNAVTGPAAAPLPVPAGTECSAVAFGPVIAPAAAPPPPPFPVDGWLGCSNGQLFLCRSAPGGNWQAPGAPLPSASGVPQLVTSIAVHPDDPRTVAVSAVPELGWVRIRIPPGGGGAVGVATFTFAHLPAAAAPAQPTGAGIVLPGTLRTVSFAGPGNFVAGDTWVISPEGTITAGGANTSTGTVTASTTTGQTITVRIPAGGGGALGVAGFTYQVGAGAVVGPQPTAARFPVPGTLVTLLFGAGAYVAGDSWTVSPRAAVAAAGGNTSAGVLTALSWLGGRVYLTWDRGSTWTDVSEPTPPAPLASLPNATVTSLLWDPRNAQALYAGTLAGVYALRNVPVPTAVAIPGGNFNLPLTRTRQLVANVALSGAAPGPDWAQQVDWLVVPAGVVTVSASGLVTPVAAGAAVVTAQRGRFSASVTVTVIPAAPAPAAAAVGVFAPPAFNPAWAPFNNGLPLTLVNDLARVTGTTRIRAGTFGRGIWECDVGAAPVQRRLYIRQTLIEEGHAYPRTIPMALRDDPRLPAGAVGLDHAHAFDIRVDAPPYRFFDDRADGVEFDEKLGADSLVPLQTNYVYVQVHNAGSEAVDVVEVHLFVRASTAAPYAAPAPIVGPPPAVAPVPALPALGPVAEFYNPPGFALAPAAAAWTKVGQRPAGRVAPGEPVVVRFDWVPPAFPAAPNDNAALLAICVAPTDNVFPAAPADVGALIAAEPRAALRIVPVAAPAPAVLHLRDTVADDGRRRGAGLAAARSPDVMVVQHPLPLPPEQYFRDTLDARPQDRVRAGADNHVYVRVHNRGRGAGNAEVHVFAVPVTVDGRPDVATANWQRLTPAAAPFLTVPVPARGAAPASGTALAHVAWAPVTVAVPADSLKQVVVVAIVRDTTTGETVPDVARIRAGTDDDLWSLLLRMVDSDNVAARAVRYEP